MLGQSKISESQMPITVNEDVGGFQISIQESYLMDLLKSQGCLTSVIFSDLLIQLLLPYKVL